MAATHAISKSKRNFQNRIGQKLLYPQNQHDSLNQLQFFDR